MQYSDEYLELKEYDYVPVRVYVVKPYRVFIYLGRDIPQRIRLILDNMTAKKIISNRSVLESFFGTDWFYLLALDDLFDVDSYSQLKPNKEPRIINFKSSINFRNRALSSTITSYSARKSSMENKLMSLSGTSGELSSNEISKDVKKINRKINFNKDDTKEDKSGLKKKSKGRVKEKTGTKKQKKEQVSQNDEFGALELSSDEEQTNEEETELLVTYIYENIFLDDNYNTVKKKIFIYTDIEPDFQHLVYEDEPSSFVSLTHSWVKTSGRRYRTDIFDILKETDVARVIDDGFIEKIKVDELYLEDYSNHILADNPKFNYDIWVFDFSTIIANFNRNKVDEMLSNKYDAQRFYISLGKKYYPSMKQEQFTGLITEKYIGMNKRNLEIEYDKEYPYIDYINNLHDYKQYLKNLKILQIVLHVNFKSYDEKFLELRTIFDNFETTDDIPFVKYRDYMNNITIKKINKNVLSSISANELRDRWIEGEHPQGIHFRIRQSLDKKSDDYNRFAIVNLLPDGKVILKCYWKRNNNATFMHLLPIIEPLNKLIEVVNQINYDITQKAKKVKSVQILEKTKNSFKLSDNSEIAFFNVDFNYKSSYKLLDYNELDHVFASMYPYVNVIINKEATSYQGSYLRYKRVSDYEQAIDRYIKFLKENYDFTDTKVVVALINIFNKTKDESVKLVEEYNRRNGMTTVIESDDEVIYDPELIRSIRKNTKQPGVDIEIQDSEFDNIIKIEGVKSLWTFNRIINFLSRMIYIFEHISKYKNERTIFSERYRDISRNFTRKKMSREKLFKESSNVKQLKDYDRELFDIQPVVDGKKYKLYSKLCQGDRKQPDFLTDEELKAIPKSDYTYALSFPNRTDPEKTNNFICNDKHYKYPGFINGSKHPKGYCLPCCYTSPMIDPKRVAKFSNYQRCLGKDVDEDTGSVTNPRYIKKAGKELKMGGIGKLPLILDVYLNEGNTLRENKNNIAENGTNYYIRYGSAQNNLALFNALVHSVNGKNDGFDLFEKTLALLKKKEDQFFPLMESGHIKLYFSTLEHFIKYINIASNIQLDNNDTLIEFKEFRNKILVENIDIPFEQLDEYLTQKIDEKFFWNIFQIGSGLLGRDYNIFIVEQNSEQNVSLVCPKVDIWEDFYKPERETIILIKTPFSIYPIYRLQVDKNKMEMIKTFSDNEPIIQRMKVLYIDRCFKSERAKLKFEKVTQYIELPNSWQVEEITKLLIDSKIIDAKIIGQLVNNINKCTGIIVNIKSINVNNITSKTKNKLKELGIYKEAETNVLEDTEKKVRGGGKSDNDYKLKGRQMLIISCSKSNPRDDLQIYKQNLVNGAEQAKLSAFIANELELPGYKPVAIIKYKSKYVYIRLNSGRRIKLEEGTASGLESKFIKVEKIEYDEDDVEKSIKQRKMEMDERIKIVKEVEYKEELLNLLRYELSKYLNREIDEGIRRRLMAIIKKERGIRTSISKMNELTTEEKKEIAEIAKKEDDIGYVADLLKDIHLSPDQKTKKKLLEIINNPATSYNTKFAEVLKILEKISHEIVKTGASLPNLANYEKSNIRHMCSVYTKQGDCTSNFNCVFSASGCNLYIQNSELSVMLENITHEIIRNEFRRNEIMNDKINFIINKSKYNKTAKEIIVTDEGITTQQLIEMLKSD